MAWMYRIADLQDVSTVQNCSVYNLLWRMLQALTELVFVSIFLCLKVITVYSHPILRLQEKYFELISDLKSLSQKHRFSIFTNDYSSIAW